MFSSPRFSCDRLSSICSLPATSPVAGRHFKNKQCMQARSPHTARIVRASAIHRRLDFHSRRLTGMTGAAERVPDGERPPALIAFDLDGTLWWPEMYMMSGPPFKRKGDAVMDRCGEAVELMGASAAIMHRLTTEARFRGCKVAYVSRTEYPKWATQCLKLLHASPGCTMHAAAEFQEIYPGNKTTHFRRIREASRIDYRDMLFFDNEMRNCRDVGKMGVTCIYTPDGMTERMWQQGLTKFAKANAVRTDSGSNIVFSGQRQERSSSPEDWSD